MAFNDFLKKAKETAVNAADTAKTKINEQKEKAAAEKAERERIRAEKQAEADNTTQQMLDAINAESGNLFSMDGQTLLTFTADFYDKLYLPAHSVSASKLFFHPLDKKIDKYAQKEFADYNNAEESPVFMILGKHSQRIFLSTKALYFKKSFDNDESFYCIGSIAIDKIKSLSYTQDGDNYIFKCNGIELLNNAYGFELDDYA